MFMSLISVVWFNLAGLWKLTTNDTLLPFMSKPSTTIFFETKSPFHSFSLSSSKFELSLSTEGLLSPYTLELQGKVADCNY